MFPSASGVVIHGGTFISPTNHTSRGIDILLKWVATGAFHNSDELYDAPKCHPHTRVAVLEDIMQWVKESESVQEDFMLWLFGPAGAGKSAIAKRIAEIADDKGILIASFFFSRTSPDRSNKDRLIATLAYQLTLSIPDTRSYIENAIERDPTIFKKNVQTQIDTLLIEAFQSVSSTQIITSKRLIIIDGLDECNDSQAQVAILEAISQSFTQHKLPIIFIVVSRPELDIVTSFNCNEPLRFIHCRLALDDTYQPDNDIRLFFSDKFEQIRLTHPLRSTIPITWPTQAVLDTLVRKSSGQFIYASTVVKFVESRCHRPSARLNIILGVSPPGRTNPFAELDALYNHILSLVDDIQLTLRVLSLYVLTPELPQLFRYCLTLPELFLSLELGDVHLSLLNLSSIVTYDESSGSVDILHASLADFLSDMRRSTIFYIDTASTCTEFARRILQFVKGPDGILVGNIDLFRKLDCLSPWIPKGQLESDILNFDLDAFINVSIKWQNIEHPFAFSGSAMETFYIWKRFLNEAGLEDEDKKEALDRLNKSLESRLQIYQSDWRLQLLLTLAVTPNISFYGQYGRVEYCKCLDILLEMDDRDHDLHLTDLNALNLRHSHGSPWFNFIAMVPSYVDGDMYASAALHCMHFLSDPPVKYSKRNDRLEIGITYAEWQETCDITLDRLCKLLEQANTTPELVQFISNHDIHPAFQNLDFVDHVWEVDVCILAFLSRETCICPNWRIISAIQRSPFITYQRPCKFEENNAESDDSEIEGIEEWKILRDLIARRRLDQCCSNIHKDYAHWKSGWTRVDDLEART